MNKYNSKETVSRGVEHGAVRTPYVAMLVGEDGRRWIVIIPIEEFERAELRRAKSEGGSYDIELGSLTLREWGDGPVARYFERALRQRRSFASRLGAKT